MSGFIPTFLFGALIAAVFDWVTAYVLNPWKLETAKERRQATLLAFAWHGPWFALAMPLFLGGAIARMLVQLGMQPAIATYASMPVFGMIGGAIIWLAHQLPPVREARAAVREKINSRHAASNQRIGRFFMASPRPLRGKPASEPEKPPQA
ncbi:MAG: hypothetical protein JWR84_3129 [Caulobacter sp.]|nr:hypothetical protein [Caulobacter sp.]